MPDEFDDLVEPVLAHRAMALCEPPLERRTRRTARLVCRLYRTATPSLRSRLLACLLKPLGTLGVAGVAAGAFAGCLYRGGTEGARAAVTDLARFSNDQLIELARFVEQVSPEALQDFARLIAERPVGMAAFSASAAVLLLQALRQRDAGSEGLTVAVPPSPPAPNGRGGGPLR